MLTCRTYYHIHEKHSMLKLGNAGQLQNIFHSFSSMSSVRRFIKCLILVPQYAGPHHCICRQRHAYFLHVQTHLDVPGMFTNANFPGRHRGLIFSSTCFCLYALRVPGHHNWLRKQILMRGCKTKGSSLPPASYMTNILSWVRVTRGT